MKAVKAVEDLTEEEQESLLTERRLSREKQLLDREYSDTGAIQASQEHAGAFGSTPKLDLLIEGVPVSAMVDTGAQFTIISRQVLHAIARHLHQQGFPVPALEKPSV